MYFYSYSAYTYSALLTFLLSPPPSSSLSFILSGSIAIYSEGSIVQSCKKALSKGEGSTKIYIHARGMDTEWNIDR
ncbi:hypothetical protein BKA57DRAFT_468697 [Linnemannia elongata]|nr:hypothetical protein BKA57DRAFT_468697 [Linnemannia elongata]